MPRKLKMIAKEKSEQVLAQKSHENQLRRVLNSQRRNFPLQNNKNSIKNFIVKEAVYRPGKADL